MANFEKYGKGTYKLWSGVTMEEDEIFFKLNYLTEIMSGVRSSISQMSTMETVWSSQNWGFVKSWASD